ncbi:MAG: hypothetical protein HY905_01610 [Deltaproteobacteria bacterium]|nr:hypothetical protein [Deltaproteobacteria bacterium]
MKLFHEAIALLVALALGCSAGSDSAADADASGDAAGDTGAALPPAAAAAAVEAIDGLAVAMALGVPLAEDGDALRRDATPTDAEGRDGAEHGFSGGSVVTPPTCATYAWSGLSATVTLAGCTLEATGEPVSGTVGLALTLRPTTFVVTFASLATGGSTVDGSVTLHAGGSDLGAAATLDADLTISEGGESTHLVAAGLSVSGTPTAISASGSFTVESGGTTTTVVADAVTWATGECLPSSGSLRLTGSSFPLPTTIVFLPTTPADGMVEVHVGSFPPATVALLPPCS